MSGHLTIFCPWQDCKDRWYGWERLEGPSHIKSRHTNFFRCLGCRRVFVQSKRTRKLATIIDYYKKCSFPRKKAT